MVNNLPTSEIPDIRDYLFIDRQRVGSLLAQFADGLPEERTETLTRTSRLKASLASVFSLEKERGLSDSQTLALADLHVSQLEETAEALGMLGDVSEQIRKRKNWLRGRVRARIEPGMLLRVNAPTQIADVSNVLSRFGQITDAMDGFDSKAGEQNFAQIVEAVKSMYTNSILVSVRAAGEDDYETGFVGEIPCDFEFGPMRKDLILSQVGTEPIQLTTLFQVSSVPTSKDEGKSLGTLKMEFQQLASRISTSDGIDRRSLDRIMSAVGGILAHTGFVSAPKWPAISIIPLAVYRNVGILPDLEAD